MAKGQWACDDSDLTSYDVEHRHGIEIARSPAFFSSSPLIQSRTTHLEQGAEGGVEQRLAGSALEV